MRAETLKGDVIDYNVDLVKSPSVISDAWPAEGGGWIFLVKHGKGGHGRLKLTLTDAYANEVLASARKAIAARPNPEDRIEDWECREEVEAGIIIYCQDGSPKMERPKKWYPTGKSAWVYSWSKHMRILRSRMTPKEWSEFWGQEEIA